MLESLRIEYQGLLYRITIRGQQVASGHLEQGEQAPFSDQLRKSLETMDPAFGIFLLVPRVLFSRLHRTGYPFATR